MIYNKTTRVNKHIRIMMFIRPTNVLKIQEELKEYERLCAEFNHSPAKEEFEDIVKFILTQSGSATGALSESISESNMNYLFESFNEKLEPLLEAGKYLETDGEAEFDTAVGAVKTAAKTAGALALGGVIGAGIWIAYMFKKGKVKGAVKQENAAAMAILDDAAALYQKKLKLSQLEGKEPPKAELPGYPTYTAVEKPKKDDK
jgi:hypothetical protein